MCRLVGGWVRRQAWEREDMQAPCSQNISRQADASTRSLNEAVLLRQS